ncbi:uncharacterized protein LOC142346027 [Convolutriloba macropyga]|uniref:uncharacterized protein LOC142346027 n=1 Tax=Convolutriloba macropyga TaxID=536237 RepID=UPI003F52528F
MFTSAWFLLAMTLSTFHVIKGFDYDYDFCEDVMDSFWVDTPVKYFGGSSWLLDEDYTGPLVRSIGCQNYGDHFVTRYIWSPWCDAHLVKVKCDVTKWLFMRNMPVTDARLFNHNPVKVNQPMH